MIDTDLIIFFQRNLHVLNTSLRPDSLLTIKLRAAIGICVLVFGTINAGFAQSGHQKVADGNRLFQAEKYDEANTKYRDALIESPESPIIEFNIGDVLYKKRNFEEALKSYQSALASDDILLQSKAYYNMGNTLYKMGKLPESILHYRKALELNPNDEEAKYNLEYVRARLKDNSQKQQQEQQQNQQNQEQQQQQQQQKENEQDQQEQEQQSKQQKDQQQDEQQKEQQQEAQKKEISKEDAERILDALKSEEQDLMKKQKKVKTRGAFRGKDW